MAQIYILKVEIGVFFLTKKKVGFVIPKVQVLEKVIVWSNFNDYFWIKKS